MQIVKTLDGHVYDLADLSLTITGTTGEVEVPLALAYVNQEVIEVTITLPMPHPSTMLTRLAVYERSELVIEKPLPDIVIESRVESIKLNLNVASVWRLNLS